MSYQYDHDVGSYSYGLGHFMKPFRMCLTHTLGAHSTSNVARSTLLMNAAFLLSDCVRHEQQDGCYGMHGALSFPWLLICHAHDLFQHPKRATPFQMTRFHTDEYVEFLHRVTPETVQDMTGGGARCECLSYAHCHSSAMLTRLPHISSNRRRQPRMGWSL